MKIISKGTTPDGRHIEVWEGDGGYWDRFRVLVDDEEVEITAMPSRLRDGGTTTIPTAAGAVHLPRKMGRDHGPDTIDGVSYEPGPVASDDTHEGQEQGRG